MNEYSEFMVLKREQYMPQSICQLFCLRSIKFLFVFSFFSSPFVVVNFFISLLNTKWMGFHVRKFDFISAPSWNEIFQHIERFPIAYTEAQTWKIDFHRRYYYATKSF